MERGWSLAGDGDRDAQGALCWAALPDEAGTSGWPVPGLNVDRSA